MNIRAATLHRTSFTRMANSPLNGVKLVVPAEFSITSEGKNAHKALFTLERHGIDRAAKWRIGGVVDRGNEHRFPVGRKGKVRRRSRGHFDDPDRLAIKASDHDPARA